MTIAQLDQYPNFTPRTSQEHATRLAPLRGRHPQVIPETVSWPWP